MVPAACYLLITDLLGRLGAWHRLAVPHTPRPSPRASFHVAMMETGVLQMLWPVLPPKARAWMV